MIKIKFKNLEKSEIITNTVNERLNQTITKFSDLKLSLINVTLEMENSMTQVGPDLFRVKLLISGGRYNGIIVNKSNSNLYVALAEVADLMLEKLNRFGDRHRVVQRGKARKFKCLLPFSDAVHPKKVVGT